MNEPHPVSLAPPTLDRWAVSTTRVPYVHERLGQLPGPDVLITALIHGNEYSGAWALSEFLATGFVPRAGRVTAAFCNVAAFARFNADRPDEARFVDEDLNRVWHPRRLASAQRSGELDRARQLLPFVDRATHLLDLHSMHEPCTPLLIAGVLPRNVSFAKRLGGAGQVVIDEGHSDGVRLRDYAGFGAAEGNRIALLLEAGQHWEPASLGVARDVLMRFLVAAGACDEGDVPARWLQLPQPPATPPILVSHRVVARTTEFSFTQEFHGGETIARAGTVVAYDDGEPVVTPYDNCIIVMPSLRQLRPGVTTMRLGRRVEGDDCALLSA